MEYKILTDESKESITAACLRFAERYTGYSASESVWQLELASPHCFEEYDVMDEGRRKDLFQYLTEQVAKARADK